MPATLDHDLLAAKALEVARLLRLLANAKRLMIVCTLVHQREATVTALAAAVGLSQSALSQHLGRMREDGLVAFRRDSQTLWYRIADPRIEELLGHIERLFCREPGALTGDEHDTSDDHTR